MNKRTFFAGALFGGSVLFGCLALWQRERQTWIPVEGEVVRVWRKMSMKPPRETMQGTIPPEQVTESWISYSYTTVDGRMYSGKERGTSAQGRGFTVYYDPDHPEESTLYRPEGSPSAFAIGAMLQFLGGIVLGRGGSRRRFAQTRPS